MITTESRRQPTIDPPDAAARTRSVRGAVALFASAAVLFVVYPALRPYSSEIGVAGARAFGSDRWVLAHVCGMVAFGCLAAAIRTTTAGPRTRAGALLGVALILPYFGAESFGLHALGRAALDRGDASLTDVADLVRDNPVALTMFGAGWIVLAAVGVAMARTLWRDGLRVGAVLVGAGLVLYLPQFFGEPWLRVAHGAMLAVGLGAVAWGTWRKDAVG